MKRETVLSELREHKQELEKYGVTRVGIFGSVARGEGRPDPIPEPYESILEKSY